VQRDRFEFAALPIVVLVLGALFAVFGASRLGTWAWILVGVAIATGGVLLVRRLARSSWGEVDEPPPARHEPPGPVHRVLIVVEPGLPTTGLEDLAAARAAGRPTEAFVVVATRSSRLDWLTSDERAYTAASRQLEEILAALGEAGVAARGHIGEHHPLQAIDDALREFAAEEIVAAVESDVVDRARLRYELPVTAVGSAQAVKSRQ
jgi:hypothetical protein